MPKRAALSPLLANSEGILKGQTMKNIDISKFDAVSIHNEGQELELYYKGEATGVSLIVLGSNSDAVRAYQDIKLIEYARNTAFASKKGAEAEIENTIKLIREREKNSIEGAIVRVSGWKGASYNGSDAFDKEGLRSLLQRNPQWVEEVINFSDQVGK